MRFLAGREEPGIPKTTTFKGQRFGPGVARLPKFSDAKELQAGTRTPTSLRGLELTDAYSQ